MQYSHVFVVVFLFSIIIISSVFASLLINSSYAQSLDGFQNFTNNDMKFSIQHPSNWKPEYSDFKPDIDYSVVYFDNIFEVGMEKVEPYLDTNTLTLKNTSLQQYIQHELNDLSSINAKIIRQNPVTVGGYNGWKIEHRDTIKNIENGETKVDADRYAFDIYTLANGKFYVLKYIENPLKVPETLPLANKMVESFQILR